MFLGCGNGIIGNTGSGSSTTITNNYYNTNVHQSSINWNVMTQPEITITATSTISQVDASSPPYSASGFAAQMSAAGTITLQYYIDVVFTSAVIYNASGINQITFRDASNSLVKSSIFTGTGTSTITDNVVCRKIEISLQSGVALGPVIWTTADPIAVEDFTTYSTGETNFSILSTNTKYNGTNCQPIGAGNMIFYFPQLTTIYRVDYTGSILLYNESNVLVYANNVSASGVIYAQRIARIEISGTVDIIVHRKDVWIAPPRVVEIEDFSTFDLKYTNVENQNFTAIGQIVNNLVFSAKVLQQYTNLLSITFRDRVIVSEIHLIGTGSITVTGDLNFRIDLPSSGLVYTYSKLFYANTLQFSTTIAIQRIKYTIATPQIMAIQPVFDTIDFTSYATGEINIETPIYKFTTSDMINNPCMILDPATTTFPNFTSGAVGKSICYSSDGSASFPNPALGTILLQFKQNVYLRSITLLNAVGTITINTKNYDVPNCGANSIQTVYFNDFVNTSALFCNLLTITTNGCISNMVLSLSQPVDIPNTTGNLIITPTGIPQPEYNITMPNVVFDKPYYISYLDITSSTLGTIVEFWNTILIKTIYVPFYGLNVSYRVYGNILANEIKTTTVDSIDVVAYYISTTREVVALVDNSNIPYTLAGANATGNYNLSVVPFIATGARTFITAIKSVSTNSGIVFTQKSPSATSECVDADWNANMPLNIYHSVSKSGGSGADIYYVVYYI